MRVRPGQPTTARQKPKQDNVGVPGWVNQPRNLVFAVLASGLAFGGGYKLWQAWRTRKGVNRLASGEASPVEIAAAAELGRAALPELFEWLDPKHDPSRRRAAAQALTRLWACDQLVGEEEQAIVRKSHRVVWSARRVYPRGLARPIPIGVWLEFDFLDDEGHVGPRNVQQSTRLTGTRRVSLESFSSWRPATEPFVFEIEPRDFAGRGPHALGIEARVRPAGLTSQWELELPFSSVNIEFDEHMSVDAILTLPDSGRASLLPTSVRLVADGDAMPLPLGGGFALRSTPALEVHPPLPFDLAGRVTIEIEGDRGCVPAGEAVVQAGRSTKAVASDTGARSAAPPGIDRAGVYRARLVVTPEAALAWTDPSVRSAWPEEFVTHWVDVEVVRL